MNTNAEKIKSILYNLSIFSIIFMYFKVIPIENETQPILILIIAPIFFILSFNKNSSFNKNTLYLLAYIFIIVVYFFISLFMDVGLSYSFNYLLRFVLGPVVFLLLLKNIKYLKFITIKVMIIVLFVVFLITVLEIPFLYYSLTRIYDVFFDRFSMTNGVRGICILTPEPSYFVYFSILLLYLLDFFDKNKINRREIFIYKVMVVIMALFTKSALVYFFLIIYLVQLLIKSVKSKNKIITLFSFSILCFLIAFILLYNFDDSKTRFGYVIDRISLNNGIINSLFYSDASGGYRFIINSIYILSIFIYPFGAGFGGISDKWGSIANQFGIDLSKNSVFIYDISKDSLLDAQALVPNIIGTIGIFSIFFILFLFSGNKNKNKYYKYSILFTLILFLFFLQSNFLNPVFWVLIAVIKYDDMSYRENCFSDISIDENFNQKSIWVA